MGAALAPCQGQGQPGPAGKRLKTRASSRPFRGRGFSRSSIDAFDAVCVMMEEQHAVMDSLQEQLSGVIDLQKALWKSSGSLGACVPGAKALAPQASYRNASAHELLLVVSEHGKAKDLLSLVEQIQDVAEVSPSLRATAQELAKEEEAFLTFQCILEALEAADRSALETWMEHARDLGLALPVCLDSALQELHERELQELEKNDAKLRMASAIEARDESLLREAIREAKAVGVNVAQAQKVLDKLHQEKRDKLREEKTRSRTCSTSSSGSTLDSEDKQGKWRPQKSAVSAPGVPPWRQFNGVPSQPGNASCAEADPRSIWDRCSAQAKAGKPVTSRNEALMVLGFPSSVTLNKQQLSAAYRRAAMEAHPDRIQNHHRQETAKAMFQRVHQAFEMLRC